MSLSYKSFVIEGNIGAGKSTFLHRMAHSLQAQCVYEPHQQWQEIGGENLLDRFYKDPQRWAYIFQTYAFFSRLRVQELQSKENTLPLQIIERSVYSDRYCFAQNCFESGFMTALEWHLYQEWFDRLINTSATALPHGFIYLRTDPAICYERIIKRNRPEEQGITLAYLQRLHDKHEQWLLKKENIASYIRDIPVLVLECNDDFEHNVTIEQRHVRAITVFLEKQFGMSPQVSLAANYHWCEL